MYETTEGAPVEESVGDHAPVAPLEAESELPEASGDTSEAVAEGRVESAVESEDALADPVEEEPGAHDHSLPGVPFIPHHALKEAVTAMLAIALLLLLAGMFPAPLDARANAFQSPLGVKPEWYFLAPFELLHLMSPLAGISLMGVAVVALLVWPFLDRRPKRISRRPFLIIFSALILIAIIALSVLPYVHEG